MSLAAHARCHSCRGWTNGVQHQTLAKNSWSRPPKSSSRCSGSSKIGILDQMAVEQHCRSTWHVFRETLVSRVAMLNEGPLATRERLSRRGHFCLFRSSRVARALMLSCRDTRRGVFPDFTLLTPGLCRTLRFSTFNFVFPRSWPF